MKKTNTTTAIVKKSGAGNLAVLRTAQDTVTAGLEKMAQLLSREAPLNVLAAAYVIIDKSWKTAVAHQRDALHEVLMNNPGTYDYDGKHYEVKATQSRARLPDVKELLAAAKERGLQPEAVCDTEVTYVPNLDKARAAGFTEDELDAMRKVTANRLNVVVS